MALIPKHHVQVGQFDIDPADVTAVNAGTANAEIKAGMAVGLDSNGYVKKSGNGSNYSVNSFIGIAADNFAGSSASSAYTANIVVNPAGGVKASQNRVSDYFNDTLGSGKMSVYTSGGEFYTDQYVSQAFTPGALIYADVGGSNNGKFTTTVGSNIACGRITSAANSYPSGVPGTTVDGSLSLGTFISFILAL